MILVLSYYKLYSKILSWKAHDFLEKPFCTPTGDILYFYFLYFTIPNKILFWIYLK